MGIHNLEHFFRPKTIAVVGASEQDGSIGTLIMRNLVQGGYAGSIFPINQRRSKVMGFVSHPSVLSLSKQQDVRVDLVIVAIPINGVADIVRQCAETGVRAAVIISAGGKETGCDGEQTERRIQVEAEQGGLRLLGPNCLGILSPVNKLNASFASALPHCGNLAFISQSGAICTSILDLSYKESVGFSHFISIGSMADVDFGDMIDFLGREPSAKSILLYIEQLSNVRKFMSAARSVSRIKPIIALKAGSSRAGALAAASHTGALTGEDAIYDAAFKRAGIIRVGTIEELFDCAETVSKIGRVRGERVAVITNGGGPGVMAADAIEKNGLNLAELQEETLAELDTVLPSYWSRRNPIDIIGDATPERYVDALSLLAKDKGVDGLLVILTPQAVTDPYRVAQNLVAFAAKSSLPVFAVWMGGREIQRGVDLLNDAGIATYNTPERAVKALYYMVQHFRNQQMLKEIPKRFDKNAAACPSGLRSMVEAAAKEKAEFLEEHTIRKILHHYGINFQSSFLLAESEEQAVAAAETVGGPVVLKIASPDISHKTDVGGVKLNLSGRENILAAYRTIMSQVGNALPEARLHGVTVQPYIGNFEYELLLGAKRDETFGPVILFGMGGVFAEVLGDRALALPPLNRLLIKRLVAQTKVSKLLGGYRNLKPVNIEAIEMMILAVSQMVTDFPEIQELDLNPVVVKDGEPLAIDARILVKAANDPSPLHLVISPYPCQYEQHVTIKSGREIFIRPILPEDGDLFLQLFDSLSPSSVYFRFFSHLRELSPEMLSVLTQVDYDRHLALVAFGGHDSQRRMLGAARIIADPDIAYSEFSILVGDPWQGQGIGAALLVSLLKAAKQQGCKTIWGTVLQENRQMILLARQCGFSVTHHPDEGTCELKINLHSVTCPT